MFDFVVVFFFIAVIVVQGQNPSVDTKYGTVVGYNHETINNFQTEIYLGIPFAAPPVTELRFEKPVPPQPWSDPLDATKFRAKCPQDGLTGPKGGESEDCLHLNIFTPARSSKKVLYPVMVWIHGGAFKRGCASEYGPEGITDHLVSKNVTVVSIQYRLGVLGFFSFGNDAAPGNFGIYDQIEALKWIHENIEAFGGDSKSVTIFGESAGGAAVSLLSITPSSQKYFHRFIEQSGSAWATWALTDSPVLASNLVVKQTECQKASSIESLYCLKYVELNELMEVAGRAQYDVNPSKISGEAIYQLMSFTPTIDGHLFTDSPDELVRNVKLKPAILGINSDELGFFITPMPRIAHMMAGQVQLLTKGQEVSDKMFKQFVKAEFAAMPKEQANVALEVLMHFYFETEHVDNKTLLQEQFSKLQSHLSMVMPLYYETRARNVESAQTFVYLFDHYNEELFPEDFPFKGSQHASDLTYVLGDDFHGIYKFNWTSDDYKVKNYFTSAFTNFAKYGNPTPDDSLRHWPQVDKTDKSDILKHIIIRPEPIPSYDFYRDVTSFWENLTPKSESIKFREEL